jgi:hypothetical protein
MLANCMNQYLNSDYEARKSGDTNDLIDLFIFYYSAINVPRKLKQLQVVKNCSLLTELNFLQDNLSYFLSNLQSSINHVYER